MRRRWLFPLTLLVLGGCADLGTRQEAPQLKLPASAAEAVGIATNLAKNGRWSSAFDVLDSALREFPADPAIERQRSILVEQWQRQERLFEDQIMVADAENQNHKISVLEKLSQAEPHNLIVTSRRIYWKEVLASKIEPLTACGEYHVKTDTALARRCFKLASGIATTADIEQRLAGVSNELRSSENAAAERRRINEEKERKHRAKVLLGEAKTAIESREYRRALDVLQKVAELQPDNREIPGLQEEALSMISPQVEALVKLGDHLYLDEQLDAAVATWQAALILKPEDEAIVARIDRAKTVLNRLDALRRQQNPPPGAE